MANGVARKARRDDRVDRPAGDLGHVERTPGERAPDEVEALALDERDRDEVRLDPPRDELFRESPDVALGSPAGERGLDGRDENARRSHAGRVSRVTTAERGR